MGFRVGDEFRTNDLSLKPGGVTVTCVKHNGQVLDYVNIKNSYAYIKTLMKNPENKEAYVKGTK